MRTEIHRLLTQQLVQRRVGEHLHQRQRRSVRVAALLRVVPGQQPQRLDLLLDRGVGIDAFHQLLFDVKTLAEQQLQHRDLLARHNAKRSAVLHHRRHPHVGDVQQQFRIGQLREP